MEEHRQEIAEKQGSRAWPAAITVIAVVAILATATVLILRSLTELPRAAVDQTKEVLGAVEEVAAAFRQGTIETRFISYATTVSGSNYLQFATVRRTEVFTRADRSSIFWGTVELPDVVVSATAPVEYTAFLDLNEPWHLRLEDGTLWVTAPSIRFNRPAIDASRIEFEIRKDSLLRDEDAALEELKKGLTRMSILRTRELKLLVRETGRRKVEEFVRIWLAQSFTDAEDLRIEVIFADEEPTSPELIQPAPVD